MSKDPEWYEDPPTTAYLKYKVKGEWVEISPDGEECGMCGDRCYLTQWKYRVTLTPVNHEGKIIESETPWSLCGSCQDGAKYELMGDF